MSLEHAKEILFENDARNKLLGGINFLANAVASSLGSCKRAKNARNSFKNLLLEDPFLNMGLSMGKEVASKIQEISGDGAMTGILLFRELVREGLKQIATGVNPVSLQKGLEKGLCAILKQLDLMATSVKKIETLQNVALSSIPQEDEVGELLATCFEKFGLSCFFFVKEGDGIDTIVELFEGVKLDQGYASPYFCTNIEDPLIEMHNPFILITDQTITNAHEISSILQTISIFEQNILLIASDFGKDVIATLAINQLQGNLKIAAIKATFSGVEKSALLEDLAVLTGAKLVTEKLTSAQSEVLGSVQKIVITKDQTILIKGKGNPEEINKRIHQMNKEIKKSTNNDEKKFLKERKENLSSEIAIISLSSELRSKKQIFENCLKATRTALEQGVVPGGGVALLRASKDCQDLNLDTEERFGFDLLLKACETPFRQITTNAGFDSSLLLEKVLQKKDSYGFNVITERTEDLIKAGVIDSCKVVKQSIFHAVQMACTVLLSEVLIAPFSE